MYSGGVMTKDAKKYIKDIHIPNLEIQIYTDNVLFERYKRDLCELELSIKLIDKQIGNKIDIVDMLKAAVI